MTENSYLKALFDTELQRQEYVIVLSPKHQILAKNGHNNQIAVKEYKSQVYIICPTVVDKDDVLYVLVFMLQFNAITFSSLEFVVTLKHNLQ